MESAFIDIGLEKDAFLYVKDVIADLKVVEEELVSAEEKEALSKKSKQLSKPIEKRLREGQEILVQVSKEPIGSKGARVTTEVTIPGKYLVFMPTVNHVGVSKKIKKQARRKELHSFLTSIKPKRSGLIVRTASADQSKEVLKRDLKALTSSWREIQKHKRRAKTPFLLHREVDIISRVVRDFFSEDYERLFIDSVEGYKRIVEYLAEVNPKAVERVKLYSQKKPIFEAFGIEDELNKTLLPKIWLKSGGYLVVEETEALVSIDVNTGKYVGKKDLEETITRTNLQAVNEVVRQMRLRDLGGIIIIDFIDMELEKNKKKVFDVLTIELEKDRSRTNILKISDLGLVEMTRKRVRRSLGQTICTICPYCEGRGRVKSPLTVFSEVLRYLEKQLPEMDNKEIMLRIHPRVVEQFQKYGKDFLSQLEAQTGKHIHIKKEPDFHMENFNIALL